MIYGEEITVFVLGDPWQLAGQLVALLSLLGFALILKGLVNIIHINEERGDRLLYHHLSSLFFIYSPSLFILFAYDISLEEFTLLFSAITLLFWFFALFHSLYTYDRNVRKVIAASLYLIIMSSVFCSCGLYLKMMLDLTWWLEILLVGMGSLFLTVVILTLLFYHIVRQQYIFVRDRLPSIKS